MKPIRLMTIAPGPTDPTSFYRCYGPLSKLRKTHPVEIVHAENTNISWVELSFIDVLFIQRPCSEMYLKIIEKAKQLGIPVWIDYDDLLWKVPMSNPMYQYYWKAVPYIKQIIQMADIISVSTQYLKDEVIAIGTEAEIVIIPNAVDTDLIIGHLINPSYKNLLWRGSITHAEDLITFKDDIIEISENLLTESILFYGADYKQIFSDGLSNAVQIEEDHLMNYHQKLPVLNASVIFVPLADNPFNRAKSNITWLEAIMSGKLCVGPNFDEWDVRGCFQYDISLYKTVMEVLKMSYEEKAHEHTIASEYILTHLTLEITNKLRYKILTDLI